VLDIPPLSVHIPSKNSPALHPLVPPRPFAFFSQILFFFFTVRPFFSLSACVFSFRLSLVNCRPCKCRAANFLPFCFPPRSYFLSFQCGSEITLILVLCGPHLTNYLTATDPPPHLPYVRLLQMAQRLSTRKSLHTNYFSHPIFFCSPGPSSPPVF